MDVESSVIIEIAFSVYNIPVKDAFTSLNRWDEDDISNAKRLTYLLLTENASLSCFEIGALFNISFNEIAVNRRKIKKLINCSQITWENMKAVEKYREAKSIILSYMLVKRKENN